MLDNFGQNIDTRPHVAERNHRAGHHRTLRRRSGHQAASVAPHWAFPAAPAAVVLGKPVSFGSRSLFDGKRDSESHAASSTGKGGGGGAGGHRVAPIRSARARGHVGPTSELSRVRRAGLSSKQVANEWPHDARKHPRLEAGRVPGWSTAGRPEQENSRAPARAYGGRHESRGGDAVAAPATA
jgi:hypothetical protein